MSTTLSTLRARVRRYLDESTADRWTNANLNAYINEGIQFTQAEVDRANPDYFLRVCTFTAAQGDTEAAIPSTILGHRIRNMQYYLGSTAATGQPNRVEPGQLEWILQNQYYSGIPRAYYQMAGYLEWAPMVESTSTFRFIYAKKEATLSSDTDTVDAISDEHTDIAAIYAAILAKESKEIPTGGLRELLQRRIMNMRDGAQPVDPLIIPQVKID
jgi:hypothetical protein